MSLPGTHEKLIYIYKIPNILNDVSRMSYKINNMTFVFSISDIL